MVQGIKKTDSKSFKAHKSVCFLFYILRVITRKLGQNKTRLDKTHSPRQPRLISLIFVITIKYKTPFILVRHFKREIPLQAEKKLNYFNKLEPESEC